MLVKLIYKHNQYLTGIQLPLGTNIKGGLSSHTFHVLLLIRTVLLVIIVQFFKE